MPLASWTFGLVESQLAVPLPQRWAHVRGVAGRARRVGALILDGDDRDLLVAAAVAHDVGYARPLVRYGFHPLDGAIFLNRMGAPARLSRLVANHSAAAVAAGIRGLAAEMTRFPDETSAVRDALWYCDCVTDRDGTPIAFADRVADIRRRHGPGSVNVRALDAGGLAARAAAVRRCEERLWTARGWAAPESGGPVAARRVTARHGRDRDGP